MKDLKKMSCTEIFYLLDGWEISGHQMIAIFDDLRDAETECKTRSEFIKNNENIINKEKLVYFCAKNAKEMLKNNINNQKYKKIYDDALSLLKNSKVTIPIYSKTKDGLLQIETFETVDDLYDNKKTKTNRLSEQNSQVLKNIDLESHVATILNMSELYVFSDILCYDNEIVGNFASVLTYNEEQFMKNENLTEDEKMEMKAEILLQMIRKYPDKFNIDKLLLLSAYCSKSMIEYENIEKTESQNAIKLIKEANENIRNRQAKINVYKSTDSDNSDKRQYVRYSTKDLEKDTQRIIDDKYWTDEELDKMKNDLVNGTMKVSDISNLKLLKIMRITQFEKEIIKKNPYNFEYFMEQDVFSKRQVEEILDNADLNLSFETIKKLFDKDLITKSHLIDMYMKNDIGLDKILELHGKHDLEPDITVSRLMEYYDEMQDNPENERSFDRYSLLFREVRMKEKSAEEQEELTEQIMEELYKKEREYDEDLKKLYKSNLLPIETLIDWNGEQTIYDLIQSNALKPQDVKNLFKSGHLDLEKTRNSLMQSNLSELEKINFIFSTFDGSGQTEEELKAEADARMYLIQSLKVSPDLNNPSKGKRDRIKVPTKGNHYITDPCYRYKLMSNIDKQYTQEFCSDGTAIFHLPNVKNGTVVIEKLYKYSNGEVKMNYGTATYVMSEEEFCNNKSQIITSDDRVNRTFLVDMKNKGVTDKLIHSSGWGKGLKDILDISQKTGYTEEKIEKIDELIAQVEQARTLMDE